MRALISVSDKTGIVEFAKEIVSLGFDIISTGGTFKALQDAGVTVIPVEEVTQFPELMNGRVKTLHPKIHGGLLARRDLPDHLSQCKEHGIELIDLVVVNLYPFEQTISKPTINLAEAIENIDIGGPSMLRSAAKNYASVGVVVNPDKYALVLSELKKEGQLSDQTKGQLAVEAFQHTAQYDALIAGYLHSQLVSETEALPDQIAPVLEKQFDMRYGENPHQVAAFYKLEGHQGGLPNLIQHHGKALSFNNIVDLESAWHIVRELDRPAVAIIKHTNPCGVAMSDTLVDAYHKALAADPVSAFGSIVGINRWVDLPTAHALSTLFVEAVIAPGFEPDALLSLQKKKNLRIIELPGFDEQDTGPVYKYVQGGMLLQGPDDQVVVDSDIKIVTKRDPSDQESHDLKFAFTIVKHVKSNAIVIVKDGVAVGVGAGQMSRVEAVDIALKRAGEQTKGSVAASDAFFPFKDSIELLAEAGITAVIQPGGSVRDQESIEACQAHDMAMVTTGIRHFKH